MERLFSVSFQDQPIGTVHLSRDGLYLVISCRCELPEDDFFSLRMETDTEILDLGLVYPVGSGFGLDTRVSARKMGQGNWRFLLRKRAEQRQCIPTENELPLSCLLRLEHCRYELIGGKPYLLCEDEK